MTETPPEDFVEEVVDILEDGAPGRDADGVSEDRLTGVAFYDVLLERYVGGVHPNKTAARKAETEFTKDSSRYFLRRV